MTSSRTTKIALAILSLLLMPLLSWGQGGGVTLIQSSVEPLPACTPAVQGQLQPEIWDITAQRLAVCVLGGWQQLPAGGGGGTITQINTTGPLTGGPITVTGTIACPTCGITSNPLSQFSLTSSAQLAGIISDPTGTGSLVFATSPTLISPNLGTPSVINLTNASNPPIWNQNTTGSAAKWTTARLLAGNSVDGSANVPFNNKFIVQGTADAGLSGAQFLGALSTGILKNATTTGVLSIAAAADVYGLWSGTCNSSTFLRGDGSCQTPAGSGNVSNVGTPLNTQIAQWTSATTIQGIATTGSGNVVLDTSAVLTTPNLGTPSTLVLTNATGLPNGGLLNPSTTVNSQVCTLGSTCTIPFQTASVNNTSQAGVNFLVSTANSVGLTVTPTNSASNQMKFEITGASYTGNAATATSAATWTTARNLAGNSVNGSANVAFANKFIVQGTADAGLSGAQFLGALATGPVKNTTTTGILSIAVAADIYGLWSGTCSSATFLRGDGSCQTPAGSGTVNAGTAGHLAYYATSTSAVSDMGTDYIFSTHTLTGASTSILDLHSAATTGFLLPGGFATGIIQVTTTTGALTSLTESGTGNVCMTTNCVMTTPNLGTPSAINLTNATSPPTWNQNTTGTAAAWTTARLLAGNSVNGTANVAFSNKFIVQGTSDAGLSGAQFMGALATGIVKNTTTTGVQSIATAADVDSLYTGAGKCYLFKGTSPGVNDGCDSPGGTGNTTSTSLTSGKLPVANGANSIINSNCDEGVTTANTFTCSDSAGASFVSVATTGGANPGYITLPGNATAPTIGANLFAIIGPSTATFTAYGLQFSSSAPAANNVLAVGAPTSGVAQVTYISNATTVNGQTCALGSTCTISSGGVSGITTGFITKAASSTSLTDALMDEGVTTANTLTVTDSAGATFTGTTVKSPSFTATGSNAGYLSLTQGTDNCVAGQPANSVCFEAPTSIGTAYHHLFPGTPSTGIPHFSYSAPTLTETISAIVGSDMTANTVTATQLASQYSQWLSCDGKGLGDGLNAIPVGTYLQTTCRNITGVTVTITGIKCFTDNNGSSTLNAAGNTLGALLTGAVTCTTSYASGTQSANVALTANDYIKFTFVSDGASKQTDWVVTGTY